MDQSQSLSVDSKNPKEIDDPILAFIQSSLKDLRSDKKNSSDFVAEISWILETITKNSPNRVITLHSFGFIFLGQYIAVNIHSISKYTCLSQNNISKKLLKWEKQFWSTDNKHEVLAQFEEKPEMRYWELRKPPQNDPILLYSNFYTVIPNTKEIYQHNDQQYKVSYPPNALFFRTKEMLSATNCSIPPSTWNFNPTPNEVLVFDI